MLKIGYLGIVVQENLQLECTVKTICRDVRDSELKYKMENKQINAK